MVEQRQVSTDEGRELAQKYDYPFFEASAKLKVNVDEQFTELMKRWHTNITSKVQTQWHAKKIQASVFFNKVGKVFASLFRVSNHVLI